MAQKKTAESWRELDRHKHFHPFTDLQAYAKSGGRIVQRAEHIYIHDADGHKLLDAMSGLWCCGLGYSQLPIIEAVTAQLQRLPYYNSFFNCTNDAAVEMATRLLEVAPAQMGHVFFTNSGSEANDTNIRLVHRYFDMLGKPDKKHFISRTNAYHGSTIAAASLGGMTPMHEQFTGLTYVHHIAQPHWYGADPEVDPDTFGRNTAAALEAKIDELGENRVAAFIAEPIQGAGGVIVPPPSYWPEIQRICDERDILLISDEVICGFGRTGNWFGCTTYNTRPDLITFAKGVTNGYQPLGGVLISNKIATVLTAGGGEFTHGFTYSGHPAACAAGIATLDVMQHTNVIDYVAQDIGPYLESRWRALAEHPIVGEARFQGYVGALELVKNKSTREKLAAKGAGTVFCRDAAIKNGLMIRAVKDSIICSPPYICTHDDIDSLIAKLSSALDATAHEYGIK